MEQQFAVIHRTRSRLPQVVDSSFEKTQQAALFGQSSTSPRKLRMARVAAACAWVGIASTFAMPILALGLHIELPAATEGSAVARFRLAGPEIDSPKGEFAADL